MFQIILDFSGEKEHRIGTVSLNQHQELTDQETEDTNHNSSACDSTGSTVNSTYQYYSCPDSSCKEVILKNLWQLEIILTIQVQDQVWTQQQICMSQNAIALESLMIY